VISPSADLTIAPLGDLTFIKAVTSSSDHIDHIRSVAGVDHIGIGSDYDGIHVVPVGLEDVSKYPNLFAELIRRGYSDEDVVKISRLNILRVFRAVEKVLS